MTKYNINLYRGDTYDAKLSISNYELGENDIIKYSVKKNTNKEETPVVEHTIEYPFDDVKISFSHNDTKNLELITYVYDVQLQIDGKTKGEEAIYKTLVYGEIKVKGDVTD